jgi:hypothetical protein
MDRSSYKGFKIGDRVSVKKTDTAYDGAGSITPDMVGIIKAFPPKVRKCIGPLYDRGDYFAYIVFDSTYTRHEMVMTHITCMTQHRINQSMKPRTYQYRAGIDICNLNKVKPTKEAAHGC